MAAWTWAAARRRGSSHIQAGTRCQDAISSTVTSNGVLIGVLSDGAGSAEFGGQGASIVARSVSVNAREYVKHIGAVPDDETILKWIDEARDAIIHASKVRGKRPRDFAATLVFVLTNGLETTVAHVGDGAAVGKSLQSNEWIALSWPAHGEYASTTFFVTDDPEPRVTISRCQEPISAIVAFTDGMERLALDFANQKPHAPFFEMVVSPVIRSSAAGRDAVLSSQLAAFLDGDRVNDRTDDDKTLLIAALR